MERQLDAELRFHFDTAVAENLSAGMSEQEARRNARLQFGGLDQIKEECRDVRGTRLVEDLLRDIRFAVRSLRKNPGFAITAVLTLALGIGANVAIFSVINTVLLNPLPYPDPDRIVQFIYTFPGGSNNLTSNPAFNVWRQQTAVFQEVSAYHYGIMNLTGIDPPEQLQSAQVSADFFRLFGASIVEGRAFTSDEDRPNSGHVVVLSYGLWQRRFGRDSHIIGKTISLNNIPHEVIGIVTPGFRTEINPATEVWVPFQIDPTSTAQNRSFFTAARLKTGVELEMAKAQLRLVTEEFRRRFPGAGATVLGPQESFSVELMKDALVGSVRSSLFVLVGAVIFVLLIACANVANLLLVRSTTRKREIAIRASLGAGRGRIIRQLLIENAMLSMAGCVLGLILGVLSIRALLALDHGNIPRIGEHGAAVNMDWHVLAFTALVSLITGILFGLIPALQASRTDLHAILLESSERGNTGLRQNKARSLLVIGEVALALVLLIGSGLLIRTFIAVRSVDPRFDLPNLLTIRVSFDEPSFEKTSGVDRLVRDGIQRVSALPGIVAAGSSWWVPLQSPANLPFIIVGRPLKGSSHGFGHWVNISPRYFHVFKIPVVRGRVFTDRDDGTAPGVVVINQAMARRFWPQGDPLNERIIIAKGVGPAFDEPARQIIGIVGDVHDDGPNRNPAPAMFVPIAQVPNGFNALLVGLVPVVWTVRTRVEPDSVRSMIENELRQASGGMPVGDIRSMDELVVQSTARQNFNMLLMTIFGCSALLLAAIGIYGLMAYTVQQRTPEIGIRVALGAAPSDVRNMVIAQGMKLALVGLVIGIGAAFGLTRLLASFLFGVQPRDPITFLAVPILLAAVALLACYLPARRATRINPMEALRWE
jgi:predicted permease